MDIYNNLKLIRDKSGLSQAKFASQFDLSQGTYAQYENGKRSIPDELKVKLSEMGINMNWLFTGKGKMFLEDMDQSEKLQYIEDTSPIKREEGTFLTPKGKSAEYPSYSESIISIPILAQKISAGKGIDWDSEDEYSNNHITLVPSFIKGYKKEDIGAAEVKGDSMKNIMISDGDIVVFVKSRLDGNGIYVLSLRGELMVKRLNYNPLTRKLKIISENEMYEPIEADVDNDDITILGKVLGWLHRHQN